ncbi:MAG: ATP synthase F1 subunit delta [Deltaproteobacteria bacterium]|nr:ATP synthase F1 subunit delta [Deltaproteobacteria bacterium]
MIRDIIAKRYAKAYFALVREEGRLLEARLELDEFVVFLAAQPELRGVLYNPVFEAAQRKKVLNSLLERLQVSARLRSLLGILIDKNKIAYIALVAENYARLVDEAEGRLQVEITTATLLDEEFQVELREEFKRLTGKEIELAIEVDESLLGGLVARYGGKVYDGSIRTQLNRLGESLRA